MNPSKSSGNLQELWGRTIVGEEALPGGRARNKKPSDFDQDELTSGIKVEQEHLVGDGYSKQEAEDIAREIAMDHLTEIPDYYTRLDKMESESGMRVAAVPKKYEHIDFTPPKGVADAAARGLELRQKASPSNRGGLTPAEASEHGIGSGVQRAVNLKNRDKVSPKVIKQMRGFLSRSEKSSKISPENKDTPWNDKGYVAWLLWGGDPAKAWVNKVIKQMEAADEKEKQSKQAALMERWGSMLVTAEENEPTNPKLWAKVQALAKGEQASMTHGGKTINGPNDGKGFTVFPSAYANGWSSKVYKDLGGGWSKKAGWWGESYGQMGDTPADIMGTAVDRVRAAYRESWQREPTMAELYGALDFVTGPYRAEGVIKSARRIADAWGPTLREASVNLRVLDAAVRNLFERGPGKFSKRLYCDHGGPCGVVADAIHEVVGGKKLGVCAKRWEGEEGPQHIAVRVAPGKVVDAWGVVSDHQMLEAWGRHTVSRAGLPPDTWKDEGWYFCDLSRSGIDMPNDIGRNPALSAEMADALRQEISRLEGGRTARGKAKKDVGHGGLDEWFSGHGGDEGEATWGDWVSISPVTKTLPSGKKVEKGDIVGECGISDDPDWKETTKGGEDPLKCMPRQKAYDMPKSERAEKAKEKYEAENSDSSRGKAPTMTPTFEKSSSDQHMAQIELMKFLSSVAKKERVGDHVYVVGGAVRNFVIDRPIKDIDVVIDAVALGERFRRPHDSEWFASTLQRYIPAMTGLTTNQYGVAILTVKGDWYLGGYNLNGEVIEIANARKESYGGGEGKGYKPDQVVPATIEEDLLRREFTFNTLLWRLKDLASGPEKAEIIDLTGCGLKDLNNMTMQCPRDPDIVFADDPTRMLRAIKFSTKYGFKIPEDLAASIRKNAAKMKKAPWEAIASIFINNVLNEPTAPSALRQMKSLGLLDVVAEMVQEQKPFAAYLSKQLRNRDVSLLLDLLELGLSDPSPLKFLSGDQQKKLREVTTSMNQDEADVFAAYLAKPTVDNRSLISDFNLTGPDRALPVQYAREALLENPNLARNSMALDKAIRKLMESEGHPRVAKSLNEKWGGLLYEDAETPKVAKEIKSIWLVTDPGPHSEIIDIVVELSDWDTLRNIMVGMRDWRKSKPAFHDGEGSALKDAESRLKKMHGGEIPDWVMEGAQHGFKMAGISKVERKREILARLRTDRSKSHG